MGEHKKQNADCKVQSNFLSMKFPVVQAKTQTGLTNSNTHRDLTKVGDITNNTYLIILKFKC